MDDPGVIAAGLDRGYWLVDSAQRYGDEAAMSEGLAPSSVDRSPRSFEYGTAPVNRAVLQP